MIFETGLLKKDEWVGGMNRICILRFYFHQTHHPMSKKNIYLICAIVGISLSAYHFIMFLVTTGFSFKVFHDLLWGNHVSAIFASQVIVSGIAASAYIITQRHKIGIKKTSICLWSIGVLGIGFGLPLFLYFQEAANEGGGVE